MKTENKSHKELQALEMDEKILFKRRWFFFDNKIFSLLLLFLLCLDCLFIFFIQDFSKLDISKKDIQKIRDKYVQVLYKDSFMKDKDIDKKLYSSRLSLKKDRNDKGPDKNKDDIKKNIPGNANYGQVQMIIVSIETDFDDLINNLDIPGIEGKFSGDLDKMLDKVLKKIDRHIQNPNFDPALDITEYHDEKLMLERDEKKSTINIERIENTLLHRQSNRRQSMVNKILRKNETNLRYCIHKHTRFQKIRSYTVIVIFEINYKGEVIRNSVKIKETNIKNDDLLRCLTRVIAFWKNFGEIEEDGTTYRIQQKWIF